VKDIKPEGRVIEQNIEAVAFFFLHRWSNINADTEDDLQDSNWPS
jgi:hypothetical protein